MRQHSLSSATGSRDMVSAEMWFAGGERIGYDPAHGVVGNEAASRRVFLRREGDVARVVTFLPGFPDGSFGWAKVLPWLPNAATMPKLFVEYLGMGDSDKPRRYRYSTAERTDLVEAIWRSLGVAETTVVAFDFSSLVVLEYLRRGLERAERGHAAQGPTLRGVLIFNGGLFTDGHTHPWFTTPILRRPGGRIASWLAGRSFAVFKQLAAVLWSKGYQVTDAEVRELYQAMSRHGGLFYLSRAAGFVADHQAQGARLGERGLAITRLPGGHLTTTEQPEALAALIACFERSLSPPTGA
jgi:pimeloyl-ACP methyl ester carboxylesterase